MQLFQVILPTCSQNVKPQQIYTVHIPCHVSFIFGWGLVTQFYSEICCWRRDALPLQYQRTEKALHVYELLFVVARLAWCSSRCSMDGAYCLPLKTTLGNESCAACQSWLSAPLMRLSDTCCSGKYESAIIWLSLYSVIKGRRQVKWLPDTLVLKSP